MVQQFDRGPRMPALTGPKPPNPFRTRTAARRAAFGKIKCRQQPDICTVERDSPVMVDCFVSGNRLTILGFLIDPGEPQLVITGQVLAKLFLCKTGGGHSIVSHYINLQRDH